MVKIDFESFVIKKFYEQYNHLLNNGYIKAIGAAPLIRFHSFCSPSLDDVLKNASNDDDCIIVMLKYPFKRKDIPEELPDLFENVPVAYERISSLYIFGKHFFAKRVRG